MIDPESRTLRWIQSVAESHGIKNLSLLEKAIRAFSLLEALVRSGCPFVFKGGTSLMLYLNSRKRLSIDIDIVCPPGTDVESYLKEYSYEYGFGEVKLIERISRSNVPKKHAKCFYSVAFFAGYEEESILLDVLFEENQYEQIVSVPIVSPFLKQVGDIVYVKIPSIGDLLGDKLTAFAPHTTGIPFFKGGKDCSKEINKQLFDIASLFELTDNLTITSTTFQKLVDIELTYRQINDTVGVQTVLDDIYNTALCITLRGAVQPDEFSLLSDGIKKVRAFIHSENYTIDCAIANAAKAAYLSCLIRSGNTHINHYSSDQVAKLVDAVIVEPMPTKLNKLKKSNIEAFFYWNEIQKLNGQ